MLRLKIIYIALLSAFLISLFTSPKADTIDENLFLLVIMTVGFPLPLIPIFMLSKAEKYYLKAEKEGRTRHFLEKKPPIAEEEYKFDAILISILFIILYGVMIAALWM